MSGAKDSAADHRQPAIVLLGPTGAGKTPLGECLQAGGLWGHRCAHFDFGQCLRDAVSGVRRFELLSDADTDVLRHSLATGALLEDDQFHIAEDLLRSFLAGEGLEPTDLVVMNGLPRHVGQARGLARTIVVSGVAYLACTPEDVYERIRLNTGGDRVGREDDSLDFVRTKVAIFESRTLPLLDYYRSEGVEIHRVPVRGDTTPEMVRRELAVR